MSLRRTLQIIQWYALQYVLDSSISWVLSPYLDMPDMP